jgi:hypothetical protein
VKAKPTKAAAKAAKSSSKSGKPAARRAKAVSKPAKSAPRAAKPAPRPARASVSRLLAPPAPAAAPGGGEAETLRAALDETRARETARAAVVAEVRDALLELARQVREGADTPGPAEPAAL